MLIDQFGVILVFLVGGLSFTAFAIFINWLIAPKSPNAVKNSTYECGPETTGPSWVQFKINYFLYALIFVAFDIEAVFLYPWAVVFKKLGYSGMISMLIFIIVLAIGLWYAWKEGALEWK